MGAFISLESIKALFGWIYFFAWSATFWPQVLLNWRRGRTSGLSHDFVTINIVGFVAYAIFTFCGYFVPTVRVAYIAVSGIPPQIELNDVLFAAHGAVMTTILVLQVLFLPPGPRPHRAVGLCSIMSLLGIFVMLFVTAFGGISWIRFLESCGLIKVVTSIIKHFPQAFENAHRRSTVGWSFPMILLDIVGGSFSFAQQGVQAIILRSWAPFTHNISKTLLALESLLFDFFFVVQHVYLYTDRTDYDVEIAMRKYHVVPDEESAGGDNDDQPEGQGKT